jgi:hypothetical protein
MGLSILLIAVGAVLAWAVTAEADGINLNTVGIILFAVGVVGLAITLIATSTASRGAVVERDRQVVIDRDQPPY